MLSVLQDESVHCCRRLLNSAGDYFGKLFTSSLSFFNYHTLAGTQMAAQTNKSIFCSFHTNLACLRCSLCFKGDSTLRFGFSCSQRYSLTQLSFWLMQNRWRVHAGLLGCTYVQAADVSLRQTGKEREERETGRRVETVICVLSSLVSKNAAKMDHRSSPLLP